MSLHRRLFKIVEDNDIDECRKLIYHPLFKYSEYLPIHLSIYQKKYDMLLLFIDHIRDTEWITEVDRYNEDGLTPLYIACGLEDHAICRFLIHCGADINKKDKHYGLSPFHLVCCNNSLSIANLLLYHGADIYSVDNNGVSIYDDITRLKHTEIALMIGDHRFSDSPNIIKYMISDELARAVVEGEYASCVYIIDRNPLSILEEYEEGVPLYLSCRKGYISIFNLFMERVCNLDINASFKNGNTLLHAACYSGNIDLCDLLIHVYKSDIEANNDLQQTPIIIAAVRKHYGLCKYLKKMGANMYHQDKYGKCSINYTFKDKHI